MCVCMKMVTKRLKRDIPAHSTVRIVFLWFPTDSHGAKVQHLLLFSVQIASQIPQVSFGLACPNLQQKDSGLPQTLHIS
ncbi:hypothetical protein Hanom_Chr03g00230531 [Helianthus anomalus]